MKQARRTNAVGFHLHEVPSIVKFTETEGRMVGARGWGGGNGELMNGDRVSLWEDEKVLEMVGDDGCTTM